MFCYGSYRFVELLWQLSVHTLREVYKRMFASDATSDPLPSALTDYSYLNAAALLPISKVTKQIADWLNNMSKRMLLPGPNRLPAHAICSRNWWSCLSLPCTSLRQIVNKPNKSDKESHVVLHSNVLLFFYIIIVICGKTGEDSTGAKEISRECKYCSS
jgi:hypothetical protein